MLFYFGTTRIKYLLDNYGSGMEQAKRVDPNQFKQIINIETSMVDNT
jgi:hypothetical protein